MKKILTVMLCLVAAPAYAEVEPGEFLKSYLQCSAAKKTDEKSFNSLSCNERVQTRFCDILNELPEDVQDNISQEVYCNFIVDSMSGKKKPDRKQMQAKFDEGKCQYGPDARAVLIEKYKANDNVQDALKNYTTMLYTNEQECGKSEKK